MAAEIIPGYFLDQKVQTVANNDAAINAAIDAGAAEDDKWVVSSLYIYPDGSSVIILFNRQTITISS